MRRADLLTLAGGATLAWLPFARAQQSSQKVWHLSFLNTDSWESEVQRALFEVFRDELRKLGYVDGKNLVIERRADGLFDQEAEPQVPHASPQGASALTARGGRRRACQGKERVATDQDRGEAAVRRDVHEAMIDAMDGLMLTKLSGWPARIAGADLALRRRAEAVLRELRTEIAEACTKLADEQGEPHEQD